jgi:hypothetical protein
MNKWLNALDRQPALRFVLILYLVRWPVVFGPVVLLERAIQWISGPWDYVGGMKDLQQLQTLPPIPLLVFMVIIGPLLETLTECTIPYLIYAPLARRLSLTRHRPWIFILTSGAVMAYGHPFPTATLASLATGVFLGYCYAHFMHTGHRAAILHTTAFHGGINIIGWIFWMLGS